LATVQRNGQQLLRILDEILDISKVEAGQLQLEHLPVKIASLISDVDALLSLKASEKGLSLNFKLARPMPDTVITDPTRLRQILINLTANAIKFTDKGAVTVDIDWSAERKKVSFWIKDTGMGIDTDNAAKLFQPFSQADNSVSRHYGGSGLGLALSRELARAMGGDVALESSEAGVGSCFLVEIPVAVPDSAIEIRDLDAHAEPEVKAWAGPGKSQPLKGINVLLVDDLIDNRELLGRVLSMAGANVDLAENGIDGVNKAMAGKYNVVLMDIQMPRLDGYQATRQLRSRGYNSPIIALTAHGLKEERDRCLEAGCDAHLTKPIKLNALIDHVSRVAIDG
jgi:CheY-like chemotaxis protein